MAPHYISQEYITILYCAALHIFYNVLFSPVLYSVHIVVLHNTALCIGAQLRALSTAPRCIRALWCASDTCFIMIGRYDAQLPLPSIKKIIIITITIIISIIITIIIIFPISMSFRSWH